MSNTYTCLDGREKRNLNLCRQWKFFCVKIDNFPVLLLPFDRNWIEPEVSPEENKPTFMEGLLIENRKKMAENTSGKVFAKYIFNNLLREVAKTFLKKWLWRRRPSFLFRSSNLLLSNYVLNWKGVHTWLIVIALKQN